MSKEADELVKKGYKVYSTEEGLVAYGVDENGVSGYRPVSEVYNSPEAYSLPKTVKENVPGRFRGGSAARLRATKEKRKAYKGLLDKSYQANREMVSRQPWYQNAAIHAGQQSDKFVQGAKDIKDIASILTQAPVDLVFGTDWTHDNFKNIEDRNLQEIIKDEEFRAMDDETSLSKLAGAAPFYAISPALQAPAKAISAGIQRGINKVTGEVVEQTAGRAGRLFDKIEASGNPVAQRIGRESVAPFRARQAAKGSKGKFENPTGISKASQALQAMAEGSLEGMLHHGMTPYQGSIDNLIGNLVANPIRRYTDRAPDLWADPQHRELIDYGEQILKYPMDPGMKTGSQAQQRLDSSLAGTHGISDVMNRRQNIRDRVMNEAAWKAAGLPALKEGQSMKDAITDHMANLKKGYQDIGSRSTAKITPELRNEIMALKDEFDGSDIFSQEAKAVVEPFINDMIGGGLPPRNPITGRINSQTFDGAKYQKIRARIQAAKKDAFLNNNTMVGNALSKLLNKFDDTLKEGIRNSGKTVEEGEALVNAWKDQNEKFAITSALIEDGSDIFGHFDPKKFENHLMGGDAFRTITGTGPQAIQDLQKLVKLRSMESGQAKAGLTTPGIRDIDQTGRTTLGMKALETVANRSLLPGQELLSKLYLEGIAGFQPSVKGFLNTHSSDAGNLWDMNRIVKAGSMALDPMEPVADYTREKMGMNSKAQKREQLLDYLIKAHSN